jgi:lysyl-tRNA synthetase, class II
MISSIQSNIENKAHVLSEIRKILADNNFTEVSTSCIRKDSHPKYKRFEVIDLGYLRDAIEEPLKYLTQFKDRVYEIGNVFRREGSSPLRSLDDFLMCEFFAKNEDMFFVINILKQFIYHLDPSISFKMRSASKIIENDFGINLESFEGEDLFIEAVAGKKIDDYKLYEDIANKYIKNRIEPSEETMECVILIDYPRCTNCTSKLKKGAVVERFEMFINGLEVAHGCQEEDDIELWKENAQKYGYYNSEEDFLYHSMKNNETPKRTSSLAMGIERLCMALYNAKEIKDFHISFPPF